LDCSHSPVEVMAGCEVLPPTPTNSNRRLDSTVQRLMMPRSNRSMRQNVLQARVAEEADAVPIALEGPSRPSTATGSNASVERRAAKKVPFSLGAEHIATPVSTWTANGQCTPKNGDRRDILGSVEQCLPLWRGSAAVIDHGSGYVIRPASPASVFAYSPRPESYTGYSREGVPAAPTLAGRTQAGIVDGLSCESLGSPTEAAVPVMATPKNSERLNSSGGLRKMMPRSNHSIRNALLQASEQSVEGAL
jgi:hypothetical protein